jgi:hypothetical protein
MLGFADKRLEGLLGGYRTPFDPRPILSKLESDVHAKEAWHELWEELHHQGDVGEASYASVPHLVRIYLQLGPDRSEVWNTFGLVAVIDLARTRGKNPDIPEWLKKDYFLAIQDLAEAGSAEVLRAKDLDDIRAILSILAIAKGALTHAHFLLSYSDEELLDLERQAQQSAS